MTDMTPRAPVFKFSSHPSCSSFAVNLESYLARVPVGSIKSDTTVRYNYIAIGALVFDNSNSQRILLVQRASTDSMPNLWEVPGGAVDPEDLTILHSVARELWEEAGLIATTIGPQVGDAQVFITRSGKTVCKFHFLVEAEMSPNGTLDVRLDPREHQNYVWATEEQVKARRADDMLLRFTTSQQEVAVLEAFEARKAQLMS